MRRASGLRAWFAAFALLTAATWALGLADIQYVDGAELAFADGFPGPAALWRRAGEASNIELEPDAVTLRPRVAEQSYAKHLVVLPAPEANPAWRPGRLGGGERLLRLRARVRTLAPPNAPLADPRDDARVMLFLLDSATAAEPSGYRTVLRAGGSAPVKEDELLIGLPAGVGAFHVVFMNRFSDGAFRLEDVSVHAAVQTAAYLALAAALAALWAGFTLFTARGLLRRGGLGTGLALAAPAIAIVIGVALPETVDLGALRAGFARVAERLPLEGIDFAILYKLGHFGFFLVAGALLVGLRRRLGLRAVDALAALALFAVSTEGLQLHLFDRTGRWSDLLLDGAGIALGALLALGLAHRRRAGDGIASQRPDARLPYNRPP